MKHGNTIKKFGRVRNQRKALMRSLARNLILKERIETTEAKAKALRPFIEKLVSKSKKNDLSSRRLLISRLNSEEMTKKMVETIGPRYIDRQGGYTRVLKLPRRLSDGSSMAIIEFV